MRRLIGLVKKAPPPNIGKLLGTSDFPSVPSAIKAHQDALEQGRDMKGFFTSDPQTIGAASSVFSKKETTKSKAELLKQESGFFAPPLPSFVTPSTSLRALSTKLITEDASLLVEEETVDKMEFYKKYIFSQPDMATQEKGSIPVIISDIQDYPKFKKQFEARAAKKKEGKSIMLCVGGPAAEDQAVLAGVIDQVRGRLEDIVFITRDYKESNVNHSAKQSHARHGNALNADEALSGHRIMPVLLMRKLLGVSVDDTLDPNYIKIDIPFTIDPKKLGIYFGNELNWLKQEWLKRNGELTEHDINRIESVLSQEILISLEMHTGAKISGGLQKAKEDSASIHVNFDAAGEEHLLTESEDLRKAGIEAERLTPEEQEFFFTGRDEIYSAFRYKGDSHIVFDAHRINKELASSRGVAWIDGTEVKRVFVRKNEQGRAEVCGVLTKDDEFFPCDKLHFTGGYKVDYQYDEKSKERFRGGGLRSLFNKIEDVLGLQKPLPNEITTSTGVSINAVFKKTPQLKSVIERHGSTGEIAVTNSHWTMIAENDDYVVMRITGGGNTGSEEYSPAYFLNVMANTRRLFGDACVGVLSSYGCPRSVNARNTTEFARIAEGALISYGKGGTGNTKRHFEAAFGLMSLGFKDEVIEFFNQFETRAGKTTGKELSEAFKMAEKTFFHDNSKQTDRRMGHDPSLSAEEVLALACLLTALAVGAKKGLIKHDTDKESGGRT